jgi:hypothetical protein
MTMPPSHTTPLRAHHLQLDISAHNKAELIDMLKHYILRIEQDKLQCGLSGWGVHDYRVDPEITPEVYQRQVDAFIEKTKAEKCAGS